MRITCFHLNQIGDLTFSLPALKCLRDSFPDATITSVVRPGVSELVDGTGLVDKVLARGGGLDAAKIGLARELAADRPDLAVLFSQSAECSLLAYLSRAQRRVGFVGTTLGFLLTDRTPFQHPPSTANNLRLVQACGGRITRTDYVGLLRSAPRHIESVSAKLISSGVSADDRIVAFSPGTSGRRRIKEWTDEGFAEVARHLLKRGLRVVVVGLVPASRICGLCPGIVDLSGVTSLGEVVALLSRCEALVAVDSGILHLAAAAGTRVVGLYGPSNPKVTGPQGDNHIVLTSGAECSPCDLAGCKYERRCMTELSPEVVIAALDRMLAHGARAHRRGENDVTTESW
jgi:heptosyltransferase-2